MRSTVNKENETFPSIDTLIAEIANDMGKSLKPLENFKIIKLLGVDIEKLRQESIKEEELLSPTEKRQKSTELTKRYLLSNRQKDEAVMKKAACVERTKYWMEDILKEARQGRVTFVASGAGHNVGKYGLPNLLANEGYIVRPLMKQPPVPTSASIRWFEQTGNNRLAPVTGPIILDQKLYENLNDQDDKVKGLLEF